MHRCKVWKIQKLEIEWTKEEKIEVGIIEKDREEKVALKDDKNIRMNEGNNKTYAFDSKN